MTPTVVRLLRHQLDTVRSETPLTILVGGYGCGKTYTLAACAHRMASDMPGLPLLWVEPTYRMVQDVALPTLLRYFEAVGVRTHWHKTDHTLTLGNGTVLYLRSGDKPERLVGTNMAGALIDEAALQDEAVAKQALARVREPRAPYRRTYMATTPEGLGTWLHRWAELDVKEGTTVVRARTSDNHHLDAAQVALVTAHFTEHEREQYLLGRFVGKSGRVYQALDERQHVRIFAPSHNTPAWYGLQEQGGVQLWADFNVSCMAWLTVYVSRDGSAHVLSEHKGVDTDTASHIKRWQAEVRDMAAHSWRCPIDWRKVHAYTDAAGRARVSSASQSDILHLRAAGLVVKTPTSNPPVRDRVSAVNSMLRAGRLSISPQCKHLLQALQQQGYDKTGAPDKAGGHDHWTDALGYGIHGQWPVKLQTLQRTP